MTILFTKIVVAVGLFACLRFFSGAISSINSTQQLTEKDNPAFGISMAGLVIAVTIMLTGTVFGNPEVTPLQTVASTGLYGILGIFLMSLSRLIFDDIAMKRFSLRDHILKGNIAVGIVDAGNMIATAIIIRSVMLWVEYNTSEGIESVLVGYLISQLLLTLVTYARIHRFSKRNEGKSLQTLLEKGNIAVALRFSGRRIGSAFAISAAASTLLFDLSSFFMLIAAWVLISFCSLVVLHALSYIADKIILANIDIEDEIVSQKNVALGAVQGAIYLSLGLLLAAMMA
ncbi:MAG: DUF350 domain-containing protein [Proteobacteria bacterium]|nr:DUF350 domain-containing protein [Pseudomonadota bacterium]